MTRHLWWNNIDFMDQYLQSPPEKLVWCLAYRVFKFTGKEGGSLPGRPRKQKGRICPNLYYYRWILIVSSCLGFSVSRGFEKIQSNKKKVVISGIYIYIYIYIYIHTHTHTHTGISFSHKNEEILRFVII